MPNITDLASWFTSQQAQLLCDPNGGWAPANQLDNGVPWTYPSVAPVGGPSVAVAAQIGSITVASDPTNYYSVGDRVRLKQGAGYLYFYILAVTTTALFITGGSDYVLVNAPITSYEISKSSSPVGFPTGFNYAPIISGFAVNPTQASYRFTLTGHKCEVAWRQGVAGTSNATDFSISAPIPALTATNMYWGNCCWGATDNGGVLTSPSSCSIQNGTSTINLFKDLAGGLWTNANDKRADGSIIYEV